MCKHGGTEGETRERALQGRKVVGSSGRNDGGTEGETRERALQGRLSYPHLLCSYPSLLSFSPPLPHPSPHVLPSLPPLPICLILLLRLTPI